MRKYTLTIQLPPGNDSELGHQLAELRLATAIKKLATESMPKGCELKILDQNEQAIFTFPNQTSLFPKG